MKKLLYIIFILFACISCRATKDTTSIQHTRDSITTVISRPVELRIPADTASGTYKLNIFSQELQKAAVGDVITEKQGKGKVASFKIIKTDSANSFRVEGISAGKDSIVFVHDTITVVVDKTLKTVVHVEKPTFFQEIKTRINWLVFGFIIILIILFLWHVERRINN